MQGKEREGNRGDIVMAIQRGDIYYADLTPVVDCEQGGIRPVVIIQNNAGNRYSPTVIVAAVTSRLGKHRLSTHIWIGSDFLGCIEIPWFFWNRYARLAVPG